MFLDILYLFFSLFSLSFLIFIHELGHYWVAKREGFEIEVFSIGFGKPIYQWEWQGVQWQVCYLIFGGYVKIKGMYRQGDEKPVTFKGSFYSKTPWQRIKVALAGPVANFILSLVIFSFIWQFGGIEKGFSEFTQYIGWVSPESEMYKEGLRAGDRIFSYDNYPVNKSEDHLYGAMLSSDEGVLVKGEHWDKNKFQYVSFEKTIKPYEDPRLEGTAGEGIKTLGIQSPANVLIYDRFADKTVDPMLEGSPLKDAGLTFEERLIWLDGHFIFSNTQLRHILNDQHALVSVLREGGVQLTRIPKFTLSDFKLNEDQKNEFEDLSFDAEKKLLIGNHWFIPYDIEPNGLVLERLELANSDHIEKAFNLSPLSFSIPEVLQRGDRIIAVDGIKVQSSSDILQHLQEKSLLAVVQTGKGVEKRLSWKEADQSMEFSENHSKVQELVSQIGMMDVEDFKTEGSDFRFLEPFAPKKIRDFPKIKERVLVESKNPQETLASEAYNKQVLGVHFQDQKVNYNPDPLTASSEVVSQIFRTLKSLFTGALSPKWLGGAVGMVQYLHVTISHWGLDDALYWVAVISLNLGILNLMPIPVLDGGYILLSFIEMIIRKPINAKVLDYILMPFMFLILSLFVYTTFNDLLRLFF
ncbi:Putative zinc metalloprotease CT_072 [Chlamydiales bacterium SCGC AB-751-O23]|jgi:regulator of sigma E protease|nr:Putative zinc metalloprotease CT_072 [Chlamydiales bacterium SCGC AB-751-O23]